jgi:hypothetical protein
MGDIVNQTRQPFEFILVIKLLEYIRRDRIIKDNYNIPATPIIYTRRSHYEVEALLFQVFSCISVRSFRWLDLRINYKSGSEYIEVWGIPTDGCPFSRQVYLYDPSYEPLICDIFIDMWLDFMIKKRNTVI